MSKNFDRLVKLLKLGHGTSNEAEAMAAIDKAHEYAATYGLDLAAAKRAMAGESLAGEATMAKADGQYSAPKGQLDLADRFVVVSLAEFCGVKVWRAVDEDGDTVIHFFGHEVDVALACYLRRVIRRAMAFEWKVYREFGMRKGEDVANAKLSHYKGMADRLIERMAFNKRKAEAKTGGRELIVTKSQLVESKFAELNLNLSAGRAGRAFKMNGGAYAAGVEAGNRVDIGAGRSVGNKVRMITSQ